MIIHAASRQSSSTSSPRRQRVSSFLPSRPVGVPPHEVDDKLHIAGILVMNMRDFSPSLRLPLGDPADSPTFNPLDDWPPKITSTRPSTSASTLSALKRAKGGGHTGEIFASILLPTTVDAVKSYTSPLTGQPIWVVGAGEVYDGRGLAANLVYGAQAVWVGTRFVASEEAGAPRPHKAVIVSADHGDMIRTVIYAGRPVRVRRTPRSSARSCRRGRSWTTWPTRRRKILRDRCCNATSPARPGRRRTNKQDPTRKPECSRIPPLKETGENRIHISEE